MRKFTKNHNELQWLFPICETEESASKMFDEVEEEANYYFEAANHKDDETFSKDDMIDSFMKGYSVATRTLGCQIWQWQNLYEQSKKFNDMLDEKIDKLFNKKNMEEKTKAMTFGEAIEALKKGKKVTREGWNGKGMFLWLKPQTMVKAEWCKDSMLKALAEANGGEIEAHGTICMFTAQGKILTGWLASQIDMLSEDWEVIEG